MHYYLNHHKLSQYVEECQMLHLDEEICRDENIWETGENWDK
jgi:hypothetical protein